MTERVRQNTFLKALLVIVALLELWIISALRFEPLLEWTIPSNQIQHVRGYSYFVDLRTLTAPFGYELKSDNNENPRQSSFVVLRDGQPLGPAHAVHDTIAKSGRGAFSHWYTGVYLSTPDNVDPRTDGHTYAVRAPAQLRDHFRKQLTIAAIALAVPLLYAVVSLLRGPMRGLVVPLKLAALTVIFAVAPWIWFGPIWREVQRLVQAGNWVLLSIFVAGVLAAIAGLLVLPLIRDPRVRVPLVLVLIVAFAIDQIMLGVSRQPMSYELMQTFLRERTMAPTVLPAYSTVIVNKLGLAAALAIPLLLAPGSRISLSNRYGIVPMIALIVVSGVIYGTRGRTEAFPGPFAVSGQFVAAIVQAETETLVARYPVDYGRPLSSPYTKIIMVVDESVRGDYLSLNNSKYDNTPVLKDAGERLVNYGVAISASNCSVAARLILRVGLQKHQLPDTREVWRRLPSIWQFAKKAGYRTALIDGWRKEGEFHSYMDAEEARSIDIIKSAPGLSYNGDVIAAQLLIDLLKQNEPMFINVNKLGVHPTYSHQFPAALTYEPTSDVLPTTLDALRRREVANYHRAIRWSVNGFFERVLPALQRDDVILIYTSDHGQSLYEGGYDLSHCSLTTDLHLGEVLVPLFLFVNSPATQAVFSAEAKRAFNRASHFEIMPTLLELMGYAPDWVRSNYGPSLMHVPVDRRRGFLLGTFFHPAAAWIDVE